MEKHGSREGQGGYGRYREVEEAIGQLHNDSHLLPVQRQSPTLCCFLVQIRAIDSYNS